MRLGKEHLENYNIPEYLYHATFKGKLKNIFKYGLGGLKRARKTYSFSISGVICLSGSFEEAKDFVYESDYAMDYDLSESDIIIIKVATKDLDLDLLYPDENIDFDSEDNIYSFEYKGIIPPDKFIECRPYIDFEKGVVSKMIKPSDMDVILATKEEFADLKEVDDSNYEYMNEILNEFKFEKISNNTYLKKYVLRKGISKKTLNVLAEIVNEIFEKIHPKNTKIEMSFDKSISNIFITTDTQPTITVKTRMTNNFNIIFCLDLFMKELEEAIDIYYEHILYNNRF